MIKDIKQHFCTSCLAFCLTGILPSAMYSQNSWHLEENTGSNVNTKGLLDKFLDGNPRAIEVKILSEGTMAYLCADDTFLFVRVSVGNPMLFMRMLMQGLTVHIDPTGKKKNKYEVVFPSARDVQANMESMGNDKRNERPDIGPLIQEMNMVGTVFDINGKTQVLDQSQSLIELDTENELLNYYILIPITQMMNEKKLSAIWSLGLYIESPIGVLEGPRDDVGIGTPQRPEREPEMNEKSHDSKEMDKLMKKKINIWEKFSIDEAYSINLK